MDKWHTNYEWVSNITPLPPLSFFIQESGLHHQRRLCRQQQTRQSRVTDNVEVSDIIPLPPRISFFHTKIRGDVSTNNGQMTTKSRNKPWPPTPTIPKTMLNHDRAMANNTSVIHRWQTISHVNSRYITWLKVVVYIYIFYILAYKSSLLQNIFFMPGPWVVVEIYFSCLDPALLVEIYFSCQDPEFLVEMLWKQNIQNISILWTRAPVVSLGPPNSIISDLNKP